MSAIAKTEVRVWDWPTRAFHWLLVTAIVSAWASFEFAHKLGDNLLVWHRWNGYFVLVLIVFRLIWGFAGSSTARFSHFVHGPVFVLGYARDFISGRKRAFLGHNPLGTMMVLALLVAVFAQGLLGLFTLEHNELVAGPLKRLIEDDTANQVTKWHIRGFKIIQILVLAHVTANILYGVLAKDPLIRAMAKGTKPAKVYEDEMEAVIPANVTLRAVIAFAAALVIVFGGIVLAGGRLF
ncbi:MAG: cytochrome b/b6 domain-containing protein [Proteobacteria bacterium]|nr:cytochrome b/b6 domain-containing protein [Pseudomonadota bacterium]